MDSTCVEIPENMRDIMITYKKMFYFGAYGDQSEKRTVTKRGFYSKLFNKFSIPPEWRYFKGVLLPHGWGGDRLVLKDVINWEYCKD